MQIGAEQWAALRLLKCWLPLAQELNETQGWGHNAPALQRLIVQRHVRLSGNCLTAPPAFPYLYTVL
jgi:hypothetical protein